MHYLEFLREEDACSPAMTWIESTASLSAKEKWEACPDGSWMAWMLGLWRVRQHLSPEAVKGLREWAMKSAKRAITMHAPNALMAAAACHPNETHRNTLLAHAEKLAQLEFSAAARYAAAAAAAAADAARYAADAARYDAARYDAADAADAARTAERKQQADDLRACVRWEWVEEALKLAEVDL